MPEQEQEVTLGRIRTFPREESGDRPRRVHSPGSDTAIDETWWYDASAKTLRNVYSGRCLALGATATKGTQLIQYRCNGKPDEAWEQLPR
ncbi:hypothetical protein GCM10010260_82280 [Streptomyces filipinensis]|uniref:Ricin B lectin domain-containing protein n=1 Tax=Streptomyces filipinensis TaxID=66887 RepID=A0A918MFI5_9ACTN|nr:RICIN domain-containing protein [Streptomyces filipinensis]GGV29335.1 hypothetical protein GCM10010260_82280 [Streptomyces filipinensis]